MTRSSSCALGALVTVLFIAACGSSDSAGGAASAPHDNTNLPPGDAARGKAITDRNSCIACHGGDYSGSGFYPNVTPDNGSGIGAWSDAQIASAIRDGLDDDGATLCSLMERFPFSDQETADVIAFLHGLPPVAKTTSSVCPGHGH